MGRVQGLRLLEALADRAPRVAEDGFVAEQLVLRVCRLGERIELERQAPSRWASGRARRSAAPARPRARGRKPRAEHVLDAVAHRARPPVELERRRGEEAAAREDLPLARRRPCSRRAPRRGRGLSVPPATARSPRARTARPRGRRLRAGAPPSSRSGRRGRSCSCPSPRRACRSKAAQALLGRQRRGHVENRVAGPSPFVFSTIMR